MDGGERGESLTDELAAHCTLLFCPSSLPSVPLKRRTDEVCVVYLLYVVRTEGRKTRSCHTMQGSACRTPRLMLHSCQSTTVRNTKLVVLSAHAVGRCDTKSSSRGERWAEPRPGTSVGRGGVCREGRERISRAVAVSKLVNGQQ